LWRGVCPHSTPHALFFFSGWYESLTPFRPLSFFTPGGLLFLGCLKEGHRLEAILFSPDFLPPPLEDERSSPLVPFSAPLGFYRHGPNLEICACLHPTYYVFSSYCSAFSRAAIEACPFRPPECASFENHADSGFLGLFFFIIFPRQLNLM